MTNKETIERNIGLTFDFVNYLIDNPAQINSLPMNFSLEFIEKDFPKHEMEKSIDKRTSIRKKYVRVKNNFDLVK